MDYCLEYKNLNDKKHIYTKIEYDELINLIDTFQTALIYIGGAWCENCQAIIDIVNKVCKKRGLKQIYNYDPHFTNVFGDEEDLRDCKSLEVKLKYYAIVEKLGFKSDEYVQDTLIPRIRAPFFAAIKNGCCVGTLSAEYLRDGAVLHKDGEDEDLTVEFVEGLISLIEPIQNPKKFWLFKLLNLHKKDEE